MKNIGTVNENTEVNLDTDVQDKPKDKLDDMLIGRIHKQQYAQTKDDIEKIIATKINDRIQQKRDAFKNAASSKL